MNQRTRCRRRHRVSQRRHQQRGLPLGVWRSYEVVSSGRVPYGSVVTGLATDVDCLPERPDRNQVDIPPTAPARHEAAKPRPRQPAKIDVTAPCPRAVPARSGPRPANSLHQPSQRRQAASGPHAPRQQQGGARLLRLIDVCSPARHRRSDDCVSTPETGTVGCRRFLASV